MNADEALETESLYTALPNADEIAHVLAAEVQEWRRVGADVLRTHRSGDVVLLRDDADAIARLLGES